VYKCAYLIGVEITIGQRIGRKVALLIQLAGITQTRAAQLCRISQPSMSALVKGGTSDPAISILLRICEGLHVNLTDLLDDSDVPDELSFADRLVALEEALVESAALAEQLWQNQTLLVQWIRKYAPTKDRQGVAELQRLADVPQPQKPEQRPRNDERRIRSH